jgi:hypothetical protein
MSDPMMRDQAPPNTELDQTALRAAGQFNVGRAGVAPSYASSVPVRVRFLSLEPLLGVVDLDRVPLNGSGESIWCPWCKSTE